MTKWVIQVCGRWYLRGDVTVTGVAQADHYDTQEAAVTRRNTVVQNFAKIDRDAVTIRQHRI